MAVNDLDAFLHDAKIDENPDKSANLTIPETFGGSLPPCPQIDLPYR